MKKIFISLLLISTVFIASAQKYPTGQIEVKDIKSNDLYKDLNRAKINMPLRSAGDAISRITYIDNSTLKYFPPIINQVGGSCAYASGIGYIYNYEYNLENNLDSSLPENIYNYLQVYSFLNGGEDVGGHSQLGWAFAATNGLPSIKDGKTSTIYEWCSGYEAYYNGMDKSASSYDYFVSDEEGEIEKMKQYLIDHGNGSAHGGLIQFSAWAHPLDPDKYNGPQNTGYDAIIPYFGNDGMHSMTIVGFDDSVWYDYDKDGVEDDFEKGAFICVNTWGADWGSEYGCTSNGRFYAPYYTFTTLKQSRKGVIRNDENMGGGTGNGGKACLIVKTQKVKRELTLKLAIKHSSRNDLRLEVGVASTQGATEPEKKIDLEFMQNQGGDKPMSGKSGVETIEFGVNVTELLDNVSGEDLTYFLKVVNKPNEAIGNGEVLYCSLLDYRDDQNNPKEFIAKLENASLNGLSTCKATINKSMPKIQDGENMNFDYIIDNYYKKMYLYLNSTNGLNIQIDLFNINNIFQKELLNKKVSSGEKSELISFSDISAGKYRIRMIIGNKYIYKNITIN